MAWDMLTRCEIQHLGDSALIVSWPGCGAEQASQNVLWLQHTVQLDSAQVHSDQLPGANPFEGSVPAAESLTLYYNPLRHSWKEIQLWLQTVLQGTELIPKYSPRILEIPVCYGHDFAPDLPELAQSCGLSTDAVVRLHSQAEYRVQMIGFSPGFPYLAGLPDQLVTPRKRVPRLKVPAGSVAIGGRQTGIYSMETPGGWNIIGRTPVRLFRPEQDTPCLLAAGDIVRLRAIRIEEFSDCVERVVLPTEFKKR